MANLGKSQIKARASTTDKDMSVSQRVASALRSIGFHVDSISPRGVGFAGPADLFEQVFASKLASTKNGPEFVNAPSIPDYLATDGVHVYIPKAPEYFP